MLNLTCLFNVKVLFKRANHDVGITENNETMVRVNTKTTPTLPC